MKLKFKLEEIIDRNTLKKETWTYVFRPTMDDWKKKLIFRMTTENPFEDPGKLNLPTTKGDVILLEMIHKESQSKLEPEDKNAKAVGDRKTGKKQPG